MPSVGTSSVSWLHLLLPFLFLLSSSVLNYWGLNMANLRGGRASLVKTLTAKMESDRELQEFDKKLWYNVDLEKISDPEVRDKFVQLEMDEDTKSFIDQSVAQSDWLFTQLWYNVAKSFLSWFYCQTDINGILNRGSMFVFSRDQFIKMTAGLNSDREPNLGPMLDLGAGDGRPTEAMAGLCSKVSATEMSGPMRRQLAARGFEVLEIDNWTRDAEYGLISALNLFDRCDKPLSIISDIRRSLAPDGLFVVALVLPFRPYVESVPSHKPSELINITGDIFEHQLESAVKRFEAEGFKLQSWSRIPYLCEGDLAQPLYHLNNALIVMKKA